MNESKAGVPYDRHQRENELKEKMRSLRAVDFIRSIKTYCELNGKKGNRWIVGNIHYVHENFVETYGYGNFGNIFYFHINSSEVLLEVMAYFKIAPNFLVESVIDPKMLRIYVFQSHLEELPEIKI